MKNMHLYLLSVYVVCKFVLESSIPNDGYYWFVHSWQIRVNTFKSHHIDQYLFSRPRQWEAWSLGNSSASQLSAGTSLCQLRLIGKTRSESTRTHFHFFCCRRILECLLFILGFSTYFEGSGSPFWWWDHELMRTWLASHLHHLKIVYMN